ncbi:hypothetical protein HID58_007271, partial [Brassica napus]
KMQAVIAILVFAGLMAVKTTLAAQHVMGGSQGWENPLTSILGRPINLSKSATNWSCDLGTPVNSLSSGNDVVKLSKTGTRYFA